MSDNERDAVFEARELCGRIHQWVRLPVLDYEAELAFGADMLIEAESTLRALADECETLRARVAAYDAEQARLTRIFGSASDPDVIMSCGYCTSKMRRGDYLKHLRWEHPEMVEAESEHYVDDPPLRAAPEPSPRETGATLTPEQRAALAQVESEDGFTLSDYNPKSRPFIPTYNGLVRMGLLRSDIFGEGFVYHLTDAGRDALRETGEEGAGGSKP